MKTAAGKRRAMAAVLLSLLLSVTFALTVQAGIAGRGASRKNAVGPGVTQQSAETDGSQQSAGTDASQSAGAGAAQQSAAQNSGAGMQTNTAAGINNASVTWHINGDTIVLEKGTFGDWIRGTAADGTADIDRAALLGWINAWFQNYLEIFPCFDGRQLPIRGYFGCSSTPEQEADAALQVLKSGIQAERTVTVPAPVKAWGTTYVECDLNAQHVYFFRDGQVIWDSPCVSGKMSDGRQTPQGVFSVYSKERNRTLKGPMVNGKPSYSSHVDYWMPFYAGYGLHDASWRGSFGGTIYVTGGSHGCVNLPSAQAAALYGIITVGTPVVVHY